MTASKVRIYDLARELKQESKRIMEDARREGVDVSVPSNTISKELAEKIRNKYFPKKEASAPRTVRIVKKAKRDEAAEAGEFQQQEAADSEAHESTAGGYDAAAEPSVAPQESPAPGTTATRHMTAARLVKKLAPAERAEQPSAAHAPAAATSPTEVEPSHAEPERSAASAATFAPEPSSFDEAAHASTTVATPQENGGTAASAAPASQATASSSAPGVPVPPSNQVRILRPTTAALNAGIRHGERAPVPVVIPALQPTPRERAGRSGRDERAGRSGGGAAAGRGGRELAFDRTPRGTPGETATPQTTYIPPPDTRGRPGRAGRRGPGGGATGGRGPQSHGRDSRGGGRGGFDRDFVTPGRPLTPIERMAQEVERLHPTEQGVLRPARLTEGATVKDFAEKLGVKPKDIVALLLQRKIFATINQPLDHDTAIELGQLLGFEVSFVGYEEMVSDQEIEDLIERDLDDVELPRSPVVTVMGHVDHGKTSLLDAIRTTDVAGGEAGGITQHIGAYSVSVPNPGDPSEMRRVVFIDTPGHEAFTMMRARGAKATDVVVLVVAADDGVMAQTKEAIEHARAAKVPMVVAINKIDRPDANPDRVKQELAGLGLQPVDWGGDVEMVPVSAKRRENLDTLLETILLTADILDLRASPTRLASGVVLEVKKDKRGTVATVLVQQGTLRIGDPFIVGQIFGKVRAMFNDRGERIKEAGPAMPIEVLGLQGEPQSGDPFKVVKDITSAQDISEHRQEVSRQNTLSQTTKRGIEALGEKDVKELLVVLKADAQGSVEVLKSTLHKLSTEQVKVAVIRSGVGAITESDVILASATQASASGAAVVIIGFNVRYEARASDLARQEGVDVRLHSIIYKVEEEIRAAMIGMLEAIERERILGMAQVREVFKVPKIGAVAGCMVTTGSIRRNARARLIRDGVVAWEGGISSVRRFKEDVSEVREGFECGIGLENFNDVKVGDQIEAYVIEKIAATEL